jgi:hypothetical protein
MTLCSQRKTEERLYFIFSTILNLFEMEQNREPGETGENALIIRRGDRVSIFK